MDKYSMSGTYDKSRGLQLVYVKHFQDREKRKTWDKQDVAEAHLQTNEDLKGVNNGK